MIKWLAGSRKVKILTKIKEKLAYLFQKNYPILTAESRLDDDPCQRFGLAFLKRATR
jgi:hypothetical protein